MHENEYYGLVNPQGDWLIEPYCHQIFKEGDVYHGMNFWIGDTLPHLPEMYNSVTLNVYVNEAGEELFTELAHDFDSFNEVDTLAWFRKGTNYRIRDKMYYYYVNTELERTVTLDTSYIFAGLFSEGLAPVVNTERELGFIDKTGKLAIAPAYLKITFQHYEKPIPFNTPVSGGRPLYFGTDLRLYY